MSAFEKHRALVLEQIGDAKEFLQSVLELNGLEPGDVASKPDHAE